MREGGSTFYRPKEGTIGELMKRAFPMDGEISRASEGNSYGCRQHTIVHVSSLESYSSLIARFTLGTHSSRP